MSILSDIKLSQILNIEELRSYLDKQIDFISKSLEDFADSSSDDKLIFFMDLIKIVACMVMDV